MKTLPLFYYPSTYVWVDDDMNLLNSMAILFENKNRIHFFSSARGCVEFFKTYKSPLEKYAFLKANSEDEYYSVSQKLPMNFDFSALQQLMNDQNKYNEVTTLILDYKMPEMDGFELARQLQNFLIPTILLTGNKDENKTIEGFNENLIQRFVLKGDAQFSAKLLKYLKELSEQFFQKISSSLLAYLETDHKLPLSDPSFIDFFETYIQENAITEYYLIDKQGSFLCKNQEGHESYLVVHTENSIQNWLEIYGEENKLTKEIILDIQSFRKIPFFGLGKEAFDVDQSEWCKHLYVPQVVEGRQRYFVCKVTLRPA